MDHNGYNSLVGDDWNKVIFDGQMVGMECPGGHNDRYFIIT